MISSSLYEGVCVGAKFSFIVSRVSISTHLMQGHEFDLKAGIASTLRRYLV